MKKSKGELSRIAKKAVETRTIKLSSKDLVCPMLEFIKDGKEYHLNDIEKTLGKKVGLSEKQISETLSSGTKRFLYRIGWTKWFLKKSRSNHSFRASKIQNKPIWIKISPRKS